MRVQKLPMQRQARCVEAVEGIAHDGVLQPGEVHANLVRAARMEHGAHERKRGDRGAAAINRAGIDALDAVRRDRLAPVTGA